MCDFLPLVIALLLMQTDKFFFLFPSLIGVYDFKTPYGK